MRFHFYHPITRHSIGESRFVLESDLLVGRHACRAGSTTPEFEEEDPETSRVKVERWREPRKIAAKVELELELAKRGGRSAGRAPGAACRHSHPFHRSARGQRSAFHRLTNRCVQIVAHTAGAPQSSLVKTTTAAQRISTRSKCPIRPPARGRTREWDAATARLPTR